MFTFPVVDDLLVILIAYHMGLCLFYFITAVAVFLASIYFSLCMALKSVGDLYNSLAYIGYTLKIVGALM